MHAVMDQRDLLCLCVRLRAHVGSLARSAGCHAETARPEYVCLWGLTTNHLAK